jgi:hypothetical protein
MAIDRRGLVLGGVAVAGVGVGGYFWWRDQLDKRSYGVVELGSGGAKWSVLKFTRGHVEQQGRSGGKIQVAGYARYRREEVEAGDDPVDVRDPDMIGATVQAVANSIQTLAQQDVGDRYVVVGSSSLRTMDHWPQLQRDLDEKVRQLTGRPFECVTVEQEMEYLFRWVTPSPERYTASVIDIGSGNTKGGYFVRANDRFESFAIEQGASSLARTASESVTDAMPFGQALAGACAEFVVAPLRNFAARGLLRDKIYLSGGSSWAMASVLHPQDVINEDQLWVGIDGSDVMRYHEIVAEDPTLNTALEQLPPAAEERTAIADVQRAFGRDGRVQTERILAGSEILSAIARELRFDEPNRRVFFTQEGQFAWSTMFLLSKLRLERAA